MIPRTRIGDLAVGQPPRHRDIGLLVDDGVIEEDVTPLPEDVCDAEHEGDGEDPAECQLDTPGADVHPSLAQNFVHQSTRLFEAAALVVRDR